MCQCECDDLRKEVEKLRKENKNLVEFILENTSDEEIKLCLLE